MNAVVAVVAAGGLAVATAAPAEAVGYRVAVYSANSANSASYAFGSQEKPPELYAWARPAPIQPAR
jgi:hypothetical protein